MGRSREAAAPASARLYYMRARYYDPDLARFISEDPIGLAGGLNPYVYAGNNPLTHRDPSGLTQEAPFCLWYIYAPDSDAPGIFVGSCWAGLMGRLTAGLMDRSVDAAIASIGPFAPSGPAPALVALAGGGAAPTKPLLGKVCMEDLGQAAGALVMDAFDLSVADFAIKGFAYATGKATAEVAQSFALNAIVVPAVTGLQVGLDQVAEGSPVPGWVPGWGHLVYKTLKFAPYVGSIIEVGEAINSCIIHRQ